MWVQLPSLLPISVNSSISRLMYITHLELLVEAFKKSKGTKTGEKDKVNLGPNLTPKTDNPIATPSSKGNVASREKTQAKMANVSLPPGAPDMSKVHDLEDTDGPEVDTPNDQDQTFGQFYRKVTTDNLPAIINKEIARQGDEYVPEWHQVKHLPGYMQQGLRALERVVFKPFTRTPLEGIQVLAHMGGNGPNSMQEIRAFVGTINKIGERISIGNIDFDAIMPGYKADVALYQALGCQFLVVQDFAGKYCYAWPAEDGLKQLNKDQKAIK